MNIIIILFGILCLLFGNCYSQAILKASPEVLQQSGDFIEISWQGIENPTPMDALAIYFPVDSNITAPVGYILLSNSSTWREGYGSMSIKLVNVRDNYLFRIWVPGNVPPTITYDKIMLTNVATSNVVTFENLNMPGKQYLSLTNNTDEMRLMWISGTDDTPIVMVGTSPSSLLDKFTGTTVTYTINQMCEKPAIDPLYFRNPGFIHDVIISGLDHATEYYYTFGSNNDGFAGPFSFISAPAPASEAYIIAFGDLGVMPSFYPANSDAQTPAPQTVANVYQTVMAPISHSPLAKKLGKKSVNGLNQSPTWTVLHIGDISYARGYAFLWDYFQDSMAEVLGRAPYMVSIGNHEWDYKNQSFNPSWSDYGTDSGGECGVPYNTRYHMTGAENTPERNLWYSFENGPIHFTVMSAEHDFLAGSPQYEWLKQDLASVDRTRTPWVVFSGHRPMYDSALPGDEIGLKTNLRLNIEPLLIEYDVNLCLWGHVHVYERMCGLNNGTCAQSDNDAPVHVLIGMAGNTYQVPWTATDLDNGNGHEIQPDYSIFRAINYGYTRFYANTTSLYFEYVGNNRNLVHDSFWLESKY
ncbi:hypothetical protein PPL_11402 [Heterostelium album PN500]|uniref:Purple acid phosphatase n=1 Tax=Heterostelium pallidum (strain ATCC 26659 / Pp 5 / PN500) TaxID=670386 RepID=D3BTA9_HETP5|nr:hypothetical protein PPL_11402 [Heterostelium album PN500]EFA75326.1 hypothetical protein PPL_11402 [Heterostelium album PN500]|eukprot:XP_020427460.1 hypothetical protein PPL_11402 [Heterostelium album PN500]